MKGVVFNLFEEFVVSGFGPELWEEVLSETQLQTDGPFVGPGTYADEDLLALVATTVAKTGVELGPAVRAFGKFLFPRLHEKAPMFADGCANAKEFLASVESAVHVEVKKLYPESYVPAFSYRDPAADVLIIEYRSRRKLCVLMEGLIEGVAEHFGETIVQKQTKCTQAGHDHCEFELCFSEAA